MAHKKIVRRLLGWFADHARDLPWRRTRDPYAIWVSEIMLQQTQVKTVIPYWQRWMRRMPNIAALAKANASTLHKLWEGLGYYTRVRNMHKASRVIMEDHGGKFPFEFEHILALPGIGRYTAGAICSIAFNRPYAVLDGNVMRVLTRIFGIGGDPRKSHTNALLWRLAEELVRNAEFAASNLNQALMELGALICTARQPRCELCPVAMFCVALKENRTEALPTASPRFQATQRRVAAFVFEHKGRFLVRQRPGDAVNGYLWEFPNAELVSENCNVRRAAKKEFQVALVLEPFCTIKHSITRFRIGLDVYRATTPDGIMPPTPAGSRWLTRAALDRLPFASAHRKIVRKLQLRAPLPACI